ncbi:hypothetical protein OF897_21465 [Chryseobacterium formosus]|uniref:DUF6705 domain-containing protein n=1 Tax=Chryseobacterium formosus TaxID=1537363 RepID=A0ABT3XXT7_9FLAO|nr:DUF6705 family protein [Chryseobacterium formosus]MCX8526486.1 hypothetical protein [Chryseobacterium formosus]
MKKHILIFLLIIMNYSCKAQQQPVLRTLSFQDTFNDDFYFEKGDYVKDMYNQLDPYVGTWKYEGNGKTFILKIQKVPMFYDVLSKIYKDKLLVTYKYIKNGTVIIDNLSAPVITSFENLSDIEGKKYGTFSLISFMNEIFLSGSIKDIPLNITTNAEIHPVNFGVLGETPRIKIYYNGLNSFKGNPASFYVGKPTFEIPNKVELIKQ